MFADTDTGVQVGRKPGAGRIKRDMERIPADDAMWLAEQAVLLAPCFSFGSEMKCQRPLLLDPSRAA